MFLGCRIRIDFFFFFFFAVASSLSYKNNELDRLKFKGFFFTLKVGIKERGFFYS